MLVDFAPLTPQIWGEPEGVEQPRADRKHDRDDSTRIASNKNKKYSTLVQVV